LKFFIQEELFTKRFHPSINKLIGSELASKSLVRETLASFTINVFHAIALAETVIVLTEVGALFFTQVKSPNEFQTLFHSIHLPLHNLSAFLAVELIILEIEESVLNNNVDFNWLFS
jgi:hypothetical protein